MEILVAEPTALLTEPVPVHADHRLMWCETCGQTTNWTLAGDEYICDLCETRFTYIVNERPALWAIV